MYFHATYFKIMKIKIHILHGLLVTSGLPKKGGKVNVNYFSIQN